MTQYKYSIEFTTSTGCGNTKLVGESEKAVKEEFKRLYPAASIEKITALGEEEK